MKKRVVGMRDYSCGSDPYFIKGYSIDGKDLITNYACGEVGRCPYSLHNLEATKRQMKRQILEVIKNNSELIKYYEVDKKIINLELFILIINQISGAIILEDKPSKIIIMLWAFLMLFPIKQIRSVVSYNKYFNNLRAYAYYLEHEEEFVYEHINEEGSKEIKKLLELNDIAYGNFSLEDLMRINEDNTDVKKLRFKICNKDK